MAEKKYTEHLGLTQQNEEDFVDGEEISRSFEVLDNTVWKNNMDIEDVKQDLFPFYTVEMERETDIPVIKGNIVCGNGKYLAIAENGYCVSEDGENWGRYTYEIFSGEFIAGFIAGKFIVCGPPDKGIYISATAEIGDWQNINGPGVTIKAVQKVNGRYFMIEEEGHLFEILNNISTPAFRPWYESYLSGITDMTYGNGKYVISTTKGLYYSNNEFASLGKITNNGDEEFENLNFESVRYAGEQFLSVTQDGNIYTSEDAQRWEHKSSLNKTVTRQIEYLNGLFFIICGRYIYATKDGTEAKSFIASLYEMTSVVNAKNKIAFYDTESLVSYVSVEKSLKEQVHELNSALSSTASDLTAEMSKKAGKDELAKINNLLKDYVITRTISISYTVSGNSSANYAVNPPVVSGYKLLYCFCNITNTGQVTCHYCDTDRVYFWNHAATAKSAIAILRAIYIRN